MSLATKTSSPIALFAGLPANKHDDAAFEKMASSGGYLPRLQQITDASTAVKRKTLVAGFYLVTGKDDQVLLGDDVDLIAVSWRFKALDTSAGRPISSTDPESDVFKSIASRSKGVNTGCQAGIEFLCWIPAVSKFATYLMGSKTALREAAKLKPLIGTLATVRAHTYENEQNIWMGPKVIASDSPAPGSMPTPEALHETLEQFNNPPVDGPVATPVAATDMPARRAR